MRGFDYQAIGEHSPIDPNVTAAIQAEYDRKGIKKLAPTDGVIGGHYLATLSGEFEHYFTEQWGGAVFVDAGDAFDTQLNANVGAGLGVRWRSPVGIIRVDFAVPVRTDIDDHGLRFHIMIGPDL